MIRQVLLHWGYEIIEDDFIMNHLQCFIVYFWLHKNELLSIK